MSYQYNKSLCNLLSSHLSHLLDINDNVHGTSLPMKTFQFSFDIVNMLPSTDNNSGLDAGKRT